MLQNMSDIHMDFFDPRFHQDQSIFLAALMFGIMLFGYLVQLSILKLLKRSPERAINKFILCQQVIVNPIISMSTFQIFFRLGYYSTRFSGLTESWICSCIQWKMLLVRSVVISWTLSSITVSYSCNLLRFTMLSLDICALGIIPFY